MFPALTSDDSPKPVAPPARFRPLRGKPERVVIGVSSWTPNHERLTPSQKLGVRYEEKIQREMVKLYELYEPSPMVHFYDDSGFRTIIPDGVLSRPNRLFIFEVKLQHMPDAWWQLERLYRPVLQAYRPQCPVSCVEICRSYDPAMPFPDKFNLYSSIDEVMLNPTPLGVLQWKL